MSVIYHDQKIAGTPELATVVEANNGKPVTSGAVKSAISALAIKETLEDLNMNAVGAISRTGYTVTLYIHSTTSAMSQNVDYTIGTLPNRYIPFDAIRGAKFAANDRDYYLNYAGGVLKIMTPNTLPQTGIPLIQAYVTWLAKYDM